MAKTKKKEKQKTTAQIIEETTGKRPERITDNHLEEIQRLVNGINRSQLEIGSMEIKKHEIMHEIAGLRDNLRSLQDKMQHEYGTFDINIQDGTINYPKDNGEADKKD
jgi:hypothetical protein